MVRRPPTVFPWKVRRARLRWRLTQAGSSAVEYALLLGLVAMISISAISMIGRSTSDTASVLGETLERSAVPAVPDAPPELPCEPKPKPKPKPKCK